ncbi:MAG: cytochrome b5 domain-containing protein [Acidimicrobiales bacterium]
MVPAGEVVDAAAARNARLGHENLGFLSWSHGFMPTITPLSHLPPSHRAWDEVAAHLPELWRGLDLRDALARMPVLDATAEVLPDRFLLRASTIVSILAHAHYYLDPDPPPTPPSVTGPWEQIGARLRRPAPHLSFTDLNLCNWKLLDPDAADPMTVENIELLIPIVGNEDERRFQAVPIEMTARFTPILGAVVRAQEAVVDGNSAALVAALLVVSDGLRVLTYDSFPKVDPNPSSARYVNPVVWGKTVAPLATPYQDVDPPPGPSGTAIPAFQLLDIFFGRHARSTSIGEETTRARSWFPPHWQDLLTAAEAVSVPDYVQRTPDRTLRGLFDEALEAYAGDTGLLGRHRLKTYGFLDLSFKTGRTKTLGGFGGGFADRLWDRMDVELDLARSERYTGHPPSCAYARVARVEAAGSGESQVRHVVLDVRGAGLRYETGSRCAVLSENGDELVTRTLRALRAGGDEPVQLNRPWLEAVKLRDGYERAQVLSLRALVTFGRIRPVSRPVAKSLHAMTHDPTLRAVIEARAEDQWELWELLEMLRAKGFDPKGLWKAHPGEREGICRVIPPESFRMYSISSAEQEQSTSTAEEIHLTVGPLSYESPRTDVSMAGARVGTGSAFLCSLADRPAEKPRLSVRVVHPPRFHLPPDPRRPVVMFAGGTGLAPFRSLLRGRARQPDAGSNWLLLGTRRRTEVYYADELRAMVDDGRLRLHLALSEEDGRRAADVLAEEEVAAELWRLVSMGAYVYVCGRTGFATSVLDALTAVFERFAPGQGRRHLVRLGAEGRLMQEIYTTYSGPHFAQQVFDATEVVLHNNDTDGYWLIVSGRVYDVTAFSDLHPGGTKIIRSYAGMDATGAYKRARHDVNPEVDAMLPMYGIGAVRRLDFGPAWTVAIGPHGLQVLSLKDVYRAWLGLLYGAVEMENALANDYAVRDEPVTYDEVGGSIDPSSPYKTRLLLATHDRFLRDYLSHLTGDRLHDLWAVTSALDGDRHPVGWMAEQVAGIHAGTPAQALGELARRAVADLGSSPAASVEACRRLEDADRRFLRDMKLALRAGVAVFEREGRDTASHGAGELVAAAVGLADVVRDYYSG